MTDYSVLTLETAPEKARPVLEASRAAFGFIPNLLGVMAHSPALAEMQNVPAEGVAAIRADQPIADARLQALRVFVRRVLEQRGWIDQQDLEAFHAAGYGPGSVLDVLVGIAQKTLSNFTNHIAHTPLDEAFKPYAWHPEAGKTGYG